MKALYLGLSPKNYASTKEIVHYPLIQIVPRDPSNSDIQKAISLFSQFTDIIITSQTTVTILMKILTGPAKETWKEKNTWVVGKATANYLKTFGFKPAGIAKEETSEGILALLEEKALESPFFFWPHSAQSRGVISTYLLEKKLPLHECILYETQALKPEKSLDLSEFDEIIFTSPSTVKAFFQFFGQPPKEIFLTSIGPITKKALDKISVD